MEIEERLFANSRDDREAKKAFAEYLVRELRYDEARITSRPVDVVGRLGADTFRFEIKYTKDPVRAFGAATITEWEAALDDEAHFRFVLAHRCDGEWAFDLYTPEQFMTFSSIPPMKVYFHMRQPHSSSRRARSGRSATVATRARIRELISTYRDLQMVGPEPAPQSSSAVLSRASVTAAKAAPAPLA